MSKPARQTSTPAAPPAAAIAVERGCGQRVKGGVYAECGVGPGGRAVEEFLIDPPIVVDFPISPLGVQLIERAGVWHIIDWIGGAYPNVADHIEEVSRFGRSARLPATLDFSKLTPGSRILDVHPRGWINDFANLLPDWVTGLRHRGSPYDLCPTNALEHSLDVEARPAMCAGAWWQDVTGGAPLPRDYRADERDATRSVNSTLLNRVVWRQMPSFGYYGARRVQGATSSYTPAIVARWPISRLAVIRDPDDHTHTRSFDAAGRSSLPVEVAEE